MTDLSIPASSSTRTLRKRETALRTQDFTWFFTCLQTFHFIPFHFISEKNMIEDSESRSFFFGFERYWPEHAYNYQWGALQVPKQCLQAETRSGWACGGAHWLGKQLYLPRGPLYNHLKIKNLCETVSSQLCTNSLMNRKDFLQVSK